MAGEEAICIIFYSLLCCLCVPPENNNQNKSRVLTSGLEPEPFPNYLKNKEIKFKNDDHVTVNQIFKK